MWNIHLHNCRKLIKMLSMNSEAINDCSLHEIKSGRRYSKLVIDRKICLVENDIGKEI